MTELKFRNQNNDQGMSACCGPSQTGGEASNPPPSCGCAAASIDKRPLWIIGTLSANIGPVPVISTAISRSDHQEHIRCRISAYRNSYTVPPGLYAAGSPDKNSDILVSANYKLSFDALRKTLKGFNVWVLVLDTKGINVWCAAGKGTFGTDELIRRIAATKLDKLVDHRRIIVPQLGAPGISGHVVRKATGFRVYYGPVRAEDVRDYIATGYRATEEMRTITFPLIDRLVLTPMEINPALKKYYPWYALVILLVFGLQPQGILFRDALTAGSPFLILGLLAILSGALFTPVLLPWVPSRSFAIKGWLIGMLSVVIFTQFTAGTSGSDTVLRVFTYVFFPLASSYVALQFTGSTTFTGMSGVKKELRISVPLYILGVIVSAVLLVIHKLGEWSLL